MLFKEWRDEIVQRSVPVYNHKDRFLDTWIHWALAAQTESNGRDRFKNKLNAWLGSIMQSNSEFRKQWELLACLTDDLATADSPDQRRRFSGLFKTAIESRFWTVDCGLWTSKTPLPCPGVPGG